MLFNLLTTGSEEHEVLQTGSIHVVILPSCYFFTIVHIKCPNCASFWVINVRRPQYALVSIMALGHILALILPHMFLISLFVWIYIYIYIYICLYIYIYIYIYIKYTYIYI